MKKRSTTHIRIEKETRKQLIAAKKYKKDTYDMVLCRLLKKIKK